jgi:hypothetical protein
MFRRFPMTLLLLVQFIPFAVIPAYYFNNPAANFVTSLVLTAALAAFLVEALASPVHKRADALIKPPETVIHGASLVTGARRVAVIAMVVAAAATSAGVGAYGVGIGAAQASIAAPILAPLRPWTFVAVGLFLYAWKNDLVGKRETLIWLAALCATELAVGLATARMAPAAGALFAIMVACKIFGLVRFRTLVAAILLGVLVWPTLANFRNQQRIAQGADSNYARDFDAPQRLRMDLLIGSARNYDVPVDVGQPSIVETVGRYGLIPRFVDPDRPQIATGRLLSVLVGSTSTSSYTFMLVGNLWMLEGLWGLIIYPALVALLFKFLLLRRASPLSAGILVLAIYYLSWMGATYPDVVIGFVQAVVAALVAYGLIARTRFGHERPKRRWRIHPVLVLGWTAAVLGTTGALVTQLI